MLFVNAGSIVLIVLVLVMLVAYPFIMVSRRKKEEEKQRNLVDSLKKGEFVLTYAGVFGKITEIIEKEVGKFLVIETGEKHKNYLTVSENAIYMLVNNNPKVYTTDGDVKIDDVKEEIKVEEPVVIEEVTEETTEIAEEKPKKKRNFTRKTTKNAK